VARAPGRGMGAGAEGRSCPLCQMIVEHDPECPYVGLGMHEAARRYKRGAEADDGDRSEQ
jgi:hypothetical protein